MDETTLFLFFDQDGDGKIGMEDAYYLPVLGIPVEVLRLAWGLVDPDKKLHLTRTEFLVLSRLVSVVQNGGSIDSHTLQSSWFQRFFSSFFSFLFCEDKKTFFFSPSCELPNSQKQQLHKTCNSTKCSCSSLLVCNFFYSIILKLKIHVSQQNSRPNVPPKTLWNHLTNPFQWQMNYGFGHCSKETLDTFDLIDIKNLNLQR